MIIKIKNLKAHTMLGIYPEERRGTREVVLNLAIGYDHGAALESDAIRDTPDYAEIERKIVESLATRKFFLLESLAGHVAKLILAFSCVREVTVEIDKPGALKYAESVSVVHRVNK